MGLFRLFFALSVAACQVGIAPPTVEPGPRLSLVEFHHEGSPGSDVMWALRLASYRELWDIRMPVDVPIHFDSCDGDVNAYYFPNVPKIVVCYPLLDYFERTMERETTLQAMLWVIGHELGHAVIDATDSPVIRQEDVADAFAVWWSSEAATVAAMQWLNTDEESSPQDEHSSDIVRMYNIQCWLYGKTDNKVYSVGLGRRAWRCKDEWQQIERFWSGLLSSL